MTTEQSKKRSKSNGEDLSLLLSDIASFASSLGLPTSQPSSGFNDVDFQKTGSIKSGKLKKNQKPDEKSRPSDTQKPKSVNDIGRNKNQDKDMRKPNTCPKPSVLSLDDGYKGKRYNRFKNMPKLPLMKANALGVWFVDVIELEAKVIGEGKLVEAKNVNEWKSVVERKREMGERLMAQYVQDYESSRGQNGDIKTLVAAQRSGTAADTTQWQICSLLMVF